VATAGALDEPRARGRPLPALLLPPTLVAKRQSATADLFHSTGLLWNDLGSLIDVGAEYRSDHEARAPVGDLSDLTEQ
jgi:hypothetical protein